MFYSTPPVTRTLIGINATMFAAQLPLGNAILLSFALWPIRSTARAVGKLLKLRWFLSVEQSLSIYKRVP